MPNLLLLLLPAAAAGPERLAPPAYSVAAEEGAQTVWVNPANLGFNPDPTLGLWYRQAVVDGESSFAASTGGGGTALGLLYRYDPETQDTWWGFNSGLSIAFPGRVRFGTNLTWNLPEGNENNFVSWDLGLGWRPLPWFGMGATARNVGDPAPDLGVDTTYAIGAVVRPLGDTLELGFDYEGREVDGQALEEQSFAGVIHAQPIEGLDVRLRADQNLNVSAGLTVWFGGAGVGAYYDDDFLGDGGPGVTGHLITTATDKRLAGFGSRVPVVEFDQGFPYQPTSSFFSAAGESYLHLLTRLQEAAEDRSVKGLVIKLDATPFSFAQLTELRAGVDAVQAAGKPVVAYLDGSASNGAYLLAAGCDKVYMHPAGGLELIGLSSELMYFRGVFELVGVEPQFAKRAEYKSAPEQYTNTAPSEPAREQMDALLDDLYAGLLEGVSEGRGIDLEELRSIIDEGPFTPQEAIAAGLVDEAIYPDELEDKLGDTIEGRFDLEDEYGLALDSSGWLPTRQIAVIYVDGPIVGGESRAPGLFGGGNTGSKTVTRALGQAAEIDAIKAVVMRVDSPGGSAFASDEIWRAVEKVKEAGKPVIVSMGGVAASGGYYVSAGATAIYAEPTTITGSIGIYSGKMSFGELYEKVGLSTELFTRGRNAAMYATSKPMDPVEFAAMDRMIASGYDQFKSRVSQGRGMSMDEVEQVARGRVWSGSRAIEVGLVDELGGLQDAIARARSEAGIPGRADVDLVTLRGLETSFGDPVIERVQTLFRPEVEVPALPEPLEAWAPYMDLADERLLALTPWIIRVE
jgi:protease-4